MNPRTFSVDGKMFSALFYWGPDNATVAVSSDEGALLFRDKTKMASNMQAGYRAYFGASVEQSFMSDAIDRFTQLYRNNAPAAV